MSVLKSAINPRDAGFKANAAATAKLVEELKSRMAEAAQGGDERSRQRHASRGKLLPRDRVERLVDPGSPFLELSPLAAFGMYGSDIHAGGIITGIGRIEGRELSVECRADFSWGNSAAEYGAAE